ncbi:MAG: hypothetical protein ACOY3X_12415 [Pseudomonadota bacterium]
MQIQKFLVTSALYLSLAGSGAAFAGDRDADRKASDASSRSAGPAVGNEALRFTARERATLEIHAEEQRTRRAMRDAHGDRDPGDGSHPDHGDKAHPQKQKALPPGLQKKAAQGKPLPPGWQAKLARGEIMATAVYAAGKPLPPEVRKQLPADPPGTVTIEIEGEVVRVLEKTREIVDILRRR